MYTLDGMKFYEAWLVGRIEMRKKRNILQRERNKMGKGIKEKFLFYVLHCLRILKLYSSLFF